MPAEVPEPPPGARFKLERDAQGRPRLTWRSNITWSGCFPVGFVLVFFASALYASAWNILSDADDQANFARGGLWGLLSGGEGVVFELIFMLLAGLFLFVILYGFLAALLFGRGLKQSSLLFDDKALWCQDDVAKASGAPGREIPAAQVGAVCVVGNGEVARLMVETGDGCVEMGRTLSRRDLDWLADVLRTWAGPRKPELRVEIPPPPADSWVEVDRDAEGRTELRWLPPPDEIREGRRRRVRLALRWLVWQLTGELIGGALLALLLVRDPEGLGCLAWLLDGALIFFLLTGAAVLLAVVAELASLGRAPRPESLTLEPERLRHDPGHACCGDAAATGRPREIGRPEVGSVRLERGPGDRDRLLLRLQTAGTAGAKASESLASESLSSALWFRRVLDALKGDCGVVEIGACLRPTDRAWLADVLRAWAGKAPALPPSVGEARRDDFLDPLLEGG